MDWMRKEFDYSIQYRLDDERIFEDLASYATNSDFPRIGLCSENGVKY